jgi:hypothetical protein
MKDLTFRFIIFMLVFNNFLCYLDGYLNVKSQLKHEYIDSIIKKPKINNYLNLA